MRRIALLGILFVSLIGLGAGAFIFLDVSFGVIQSENEEASQEIDDSFERREMIRRTDIDIGTVYRTADGRNAVVIRNIGSRNLTVIDDGSQTIGVLVNDQEVSWSLPEQERSENIEIQPTSTIALITESDATGSNKYTVNGPYDSTDSETTRAVE